MEEITGRPIITLLLGANAGFNILACGRFAFNLYKENSVCADAEMQRRSAKNVKRILMG
jgi:hypothetical protein